ncbi:MAG TPA: VWA domain-containing protein [Bacteroidaceae bacterium]|nr:VWA domain-containing protein [Bacteroidaceae bacterium]
MFRFANPEYLNLLILLLFLAVVYIYSNIKRSRKLNIYGDPELITQLMPEMSVARPKIKFWTMFLSIALICFLLARPQFGSRQETVVRSGVETIIALDVSNSMLADDVAPNRLEKSKRIVSNLVDQFKDDKLGLVIFAGEAYVQLPITSDFVSAKIFLSSISPNLISRQGTNIKDALDLSMKSFTPNEGMGKAIILITDGENHEGGAVESAKKAAENGFKVYVLGIGSHSGSPIPASDNSGGFRKDKSGNVIVTRLNEKMCQEIAVAGNGSYFYVDNSNSAEKALQKEIDKLAKKDIESTVYTEFDEQFQVIAWATLILLVIEMLISNSRNPILSRIKLFRLNNLSGKE